MNRTNLIEEIVYTLGQNAFADFITDRVIDYTNDIIITCSSEENNDELPGHSLCYIDVITPTRLTNETVQATLLDDDYPAAFHSVHVYGVVFDGVTYETHENSTAFISSYRFWVKPEL